MPTLWDSDLDRKLLLVALDPANKPDWAAVATTMGGDFTSEGVRQHYAKLKKEAAALIERDPTSAAADAVKAPTPKTPRKRKAANDTPNNTPTKRTRTPRKKKVAQEDAKKTAVNNKTETDVTSSTPVAENTNGKEPDKTGDVKIETDETSTDTPVVKAETEEEDA